MFIANWHSITCLHERRNRWAAYCGEYCVDLRKRQELRKWHGMTREKNTQNIDCSLRRWHHSNGGEVECQREGARNSSMERWWTLAWLTLCDILVWHFMTLTGFTPFYPRKDILKLPGSKNGETLLARDLMLVRTMNLPSHTRTNRIQTSEADWSNVCELTSLQNQLVFNPLCPVPGRLVSRLRWWLMVN